MRVRASPWYVRLSLWTVVCGLSAAPSFFFGAMAFDRTGHIIAMLTGVATFIAGYTWITGRPWVVRLRRRPFVNRTLRIGYLTRIVLSLASLVPPVAILDLYCGMLSIAVVAGRADSRTMPLQVYFITLMQGLMLNVILMVYMALVWGAQRLFLPSPPPDLEGHCLRCGYDLRASLVACPECGTAIDADTARFIAERTEIEIPKGADGRL